MVLLDVWIMIVNWPTNSNRSNLLFSEEKNDKSLKCVARLSTSPDNCFWFSRPVKLIKFTFTINDFNFWLGLCEEVEKILEYYFQLVHIDTWFIILIQSPEIDRLSQC